MESMAMKPTELSAREERMMWVSKRHPESGYAAVLFGSSPIDADGNFSLDDVVGFTCEEGIEEYAAGVRARLSEIPFAEDAHLRWRAGWEDADKELLEEAAS